MITKVIILKKGLKGFMGGLNDKTRAAKRSESKGRDSQIYGLYSGDYEVENG